MPSQLKNRILQICLENKISHIGSFISSVDIIDYIYSKKRNEDIFILSAGHAGLALYVVLEKYLGLDALKLYKKHGLHPHRDMGDGIYCSSGSLGCGVAIALGCAIANPDRIVHCLVSDGECYEGVVWETLTCAKEQKINNLKIYVNANGFAAYKSVDLPDLKKKLLSFFNVEFIETNFDNIKCLRGIDAHYKVLSDSDL